MQITKKSLNNATVAAKSSTKSVKNVAPVATTAVTAMRFNSALRAY